MRDNKAHVMLNRRQTALHGCYRISNLMSASVDGKYEILSKYKATAFVLGMLKLRTVGLRVALL
jgi:hypothetical protein